MYRLSTDEIREAERFDQWRDAARSMQGVTEHWDARFEGAFRGAVELRQIGSLRRSRVTSATSFSQRSERSIANVSFGSYVIYREVGAGSLFDNGCASFELRRDELMVLDFDAPCTFFSPQGFAYDMLMLPKTFVDPHLLFRRRPLALRLSGRPGLEALAASYYHAVLREWDEMSGDEIASAADALGRLIGVAAGAVAEEHAEAIARARLRKLNATSTPISPNPCSPRERRGGVETVGTHAPWSVRTARRFLRGASASASPRGMPPCADRRSVAAGDRRRLRLGVRQLAELLSRLPGGVRHVARRSQAGGAGQRVVSIRRDAEARKVRRAGYRGSAK